MQRWTHLKRMSRWPLYLECSDRYRFQWLHIVGVSLEELSSRKERMARKTDLRDPRQSKRASQK